MKKATLIIILAVTYFTVTAQVQTDKVHDNGLTPSNWTKVCKDKKYGFIDETGKEIVKPKYDLINNFGDKGIGNWTLVRIGNKYGFIDYSGKEIVKPKYDSIYNFCEKGIGNWALVRIGNKFGFIDDTGNEIVKPIYDSIN